jgi:AraC-like DNA-binding protein
MADSSSRFEIIVPDYIRCGFYDSSDKVKFHSHPGTELVYLVQGECEISVEKVKLYGYAGTLFILPAGILHNQINFKRVRTKYVIFNKYPHFDETPRTLALPDDVWISEWLDDIFGLQKEHHDNITALCSGLLYLILQRISEIERTEQQHGKYPPPLSRAISFIEQNFASQIMLTDVAAKAGICPEYLCVLFKKHLNKSPVSYILELRLKYARQLLGDLYLSVKDVSLLCGFNSPNYFSRSFRKHFGKAPLELRSSQNTVQHGIRRP